MNSLQKNQDQFKTNRPMVAIKIIGLALLTLFTISTSAQKKPGKHKIHNLTADQIAELQTKQLTLDLELTEKQQQQILEINKRKAQERKQKMVAQKALLEKGEKPSNVELVKRKSAHLDAQIVHQKEMKSILTEKQFETWKRSRKHKAHKMKKRMGRKKLQKKRKNRS